MSTLVERLQYERERVRVWQASLFEFWLRFRPNHAALFGLVVLVIIALVALFAPVLAPFPPQRVSYDTFEPPNAKHWLGTDDLGRDTFSGIVMSTRTSLLVGIVASLTSLSIGIVIGSIAGFLGGRVDDWLMRFTEFVLITPPFFLILVAVAIVGPSLLNIILVIGFFSWPRIARVVRALFLSLKEEDYVLAARATGVRDARII